MTEFVDLHRLKEDERINMIGHRCVDHKEQVGFVVEASDKDKIERYKTKLTTKFPGVQIVYEGYLDYGKFLWLMKAEFKGE
jgi:hypothetical protein